MEEIPIYGLLQKVKILFRLTFKIGIVVVWRI